MSGKLGSNIKSLNQKLQNIQVKLQPELLN